MSSPPPTMRSISPIDLASERALLGDELGQALLRVLESGHYILGPDVERLEQEFAQRCRCAQGVAVASGTDALVLGLRAIGVEPGDRVLTSPFTFFASAGAIAWMGAIPTLADVDPNTGLLDPRAAAAAIDGDTKALLPVHLYGQMADMRALRELADQHGLALLEDGAQAHGAERDGAAPGELGDACTFSFYPTKNLGAAGEGGLVVTRDEAIGERLRRLRDHGSPAKYSHAFIGTNSRMHAFQGAILCAKLPHLDAWNERRRAIAARYDAAFAESERLRPLLCHSGSTHAYHQYTLRVEAPASRDDLLAGLAQRGIGAAVHYPVPVHMQEAAAQWGYREGDFPHAERLAREVLCLPVHPFLSDDDVEHVIASALDLA